MKRNLFFTLTFILIIGVISCAYAVDPGYEQRKQQRLDALYAAEEEYRSLIDDDEFGQIDGYFISSDYEQPAEMRNAAIKVEQARKALLADFSCSTTDEKDVEYFTTPTLPAKLYFNNDTSNYDTLNWYVWSNETGTWQWFSNEPVAEYNCWHEGDYSIKLVKDNDPSNYVIRDYHVSVNNFEVINPLTGEPTYYSPLPYGVLPKAAKMKNNSDNCFSFAWYVWSVEKGSWEWVSNEREPTINLWAFSNSAFPYTSIKMVKNGDPLDFYITDAFSDIVAFSVKYKNTNVTDTAFSSEEYPAQIKLSPNSTCENIQTLDWYIWDRANSCWSLFSNEKAPEFQLWNEGTNSIKLVKNGDPNNYVIHDITVNFANK